MKTAALPTRNLGDIVRYASNGSTALMKIEHVVTYSDGTRRYYGTHILGGFHSTSERACIDPTPEDLTLWKGYESRAAVDGTSKPSIERANERIHRLSDLVEALNEECKPEPTDSDELRAFKTRLLKRIATTPK